MKITRSHRRRRGIALVDIFALLAMCVVTQTVAAAALDGQTLFMDAGKGNCAACHGAAAGKRLGPVLVDMKARFPDGAKLRDIIRDASQFNPQTIMPPYARHRILSEEEIGAIVKYVETL